VSTDEILDVLGRRRSWCVEHGDCLEVLRGLPDACIDSVVTDPPYGIAFMGNTWDKFRGRGRGRTETEVPPGAGGDIASDAYVEYDVTLEGNRRYQAWCTEWAKELLRVLKPGGYLLATGAPRTYHRMTAGIEDAGFEIRDAKAWLFGSGFPKYLNVSKAIDDHLFGKWLELNPEADGWWKASAVLTRWVKQIPVGERDPVWKKRIKQAREMVKAAWGKKREVIHRYAAGGNAAISIEEKGGTYVVGADSKGAEAIELTVTRGATKEARAWDGWTTALKPGFEPIVVARKPLEGTVAENVLKHGTGAMNIDACRVRTDWNEPDRPASWRKSGHSRKPEAEKLAAPPGDGIDCHPGGRYPPNVLFAHTPGCVNECSDDCPVKLLEDLGGELGRFFPQFDWDQDPGDPFLYTPKASRAEREAGCDGISSRAGSKAVRREAGSDGVNNPRAGAGRTAGAVRNAHPNVKPDALERWRVRLVTPPGGVVLDPFCGSGSVGRAAWAEGFRFVGIEKQDTEDEPFVSIARARIAFVAKSGRQLSLF